MNRTGCATFEQQAAIGLRGFGGKFRALRSLPAAMIDQALVWQERARERRRLRELDDYLLRDMGLSRADVEREASIPFWRQS